VIGQVTFVAKQSDSAGEVQGAQGGAEAHPTMPGTDDNDMSCHIVVSVVCWQAGGICAGRCLFLKKPLQQSFYLRGRLMVADVPDTVDHLQPDVWILCGHGLHVGHGAATVIMLRRH
jgi:hypothetical protein